jgi:beta-lactamase class A
VADRGLAAELTRMFDAAGVQGFLHVLDIDSGEIAGYRDQEPVLLASTRKVALLLELWRGIDAGEWSATERIRVSPPSPAPTGYGLAQFKDDVEISLRDLATQMISVSDNVATALIADRVGAGRVNRMLAGLGLSKIHFRHPTYDQAAHDPALPFAQPALGARATPEAAARLLAMIWRDQAGSPAACAEVRRTLATQVFMHRIRSGFPDEVKTAGKTGSWMGWKNEIGVAEFPDSRRFAIAVFTCLKEPPEQTRLTPQDLVVGASAATAVARLRDLRTV